MFTATTPGGAPRLDQIDWTWATLKTPLLTMPFNITGHPAIATRAGMTTTGLPMSFQLVGRPFDEATILAAAHAYEAATEWVRLRPALSS